MKKNVIAASTGVVSSLFIANVGLSATHAMVDAKLADSKIDLIKDNSAAKQLVLKLPADASSRKKLTNLNPELLLPANSATKLTKDDLVNVAKIASLLSLSDKTEAKVVLNGNWASIDGKWTHLEGKLDPLNELKNKLGGNVSDSTTSSENSESSESTESCETSETSEDSEKSEGNESGLFPGGLVDKIINSKINPSPIADLSIIDLRSVFPR